ncbi:MAG: hypothetical protein SFW67_21545 [Myxococcaceae bacterium]|nr:hypothetical protein [Myxococcaceae bacterium]
MRRWKGAVVLGGLMAVAMPLRVAVALRSERPAARLQVLGARIDAHDGPGLAPGAPFDGEWWLVIHSFSIAASANLAFRHPEDAPARRVEIARWLELMLKPDVRAFDTTKWNEDALESLDGSKGHVGVLGHVAWALGASCLVGNAPHPLVGPIADGLSSRFAASPLLETYPGEIYVPDNLVAIAGLSLLRRCQGAPEDPEVRRFVERLERDHLDAETGLFVFAPGQPARGSGAAWTAYFLSFVDDGRAREQFERLFGVFGAELPFGALAVREWPAGVDRGGDVDSGPLVFGLSPSATGFAMAGPALTNDVERLSALRVTAETVGVTVNDRFLLSPLVGDAIVLATSTATPWTDAFVSSPSARQ